MALVLGVAGFAVALGTPALASVPAAPKITATTVTFPVPTASGNTFTLRLWSHGALEGSDSGTTGMLTVAVPATTDCAFQADVTARTPSGFQYFYSGSRATVPGCGPPASIAGHIYLCAADGTTTTTEVPGGTLGASGPKTVTTQGNPLGSTTVPAGTFSMTAAAPSGYVFVVCGGSSTIGSSGTDATEPVTVPSGGNGVGTFYVVVAAPTGSLSGGSGPGGSPGGGSITGPPTSPGSSGAVPSVSATAPTKVVAAHLAFTGLAAGPFLLLGFGSLVLGTSALYLSRVRRRTALARHAVTRRRR